MGVIQRQSVKNNAVALSAVLIGAMSNLFIYPNDLALQGYIVAVVKWGLLLSPFVLMGTTTALVRFQAYTGRENDPTNGRLLTRALSVVTGMVTLLVLANWLLGNSAVSQLQIHGWRLGVLAESRWAIIGVVAGLAYAEVLTSHLAIFRKIATPVIFNNLLIKIATPLLFCAFFYQWFSADLLDFGIALMYGAAAAGLLLYALYLGLIKPSFKPLELTGATKASMYSVAGFSIFGSVGARLSSQIDSISVNALLGDFDTAVYTFALFVVTLVLIPATAINTITSPIVAEDWKHKRMDHLSFLYRETSLVLFALGGLIYVGSLVCLPHLYDLTPQLAQHRAGYLAVICLGGGQLFDLLTSINGNLVSMTAYYRWNVVFIFVLGLLNIALNYLFIVTLSFGVSGAAMATACSLFLYNFLKVALVKWKMGIQPFATGHLHTFAALAFFGVLAHFAPVPDIPMVAILIKGSIVTVPFLLVLRYTNTVPPVRRLLSNGIKNVFR